LRRTCEAPISPSRPGQGQGQRWEASPSETASSNGTVSPLGSMASPDGFGIKRRWCKSQHRRPAEPTSPGAQAGPPLPSPAAAVAKTVAPLAAPAFGVALQPMPLNAPRMAPEAAVAPAAGLAARGGEGHSGSETAPRAAAAAVAAAASAVEPAAASAACSSPPGSPRSPSPPVAAATIVRAATQPELLHGQRAHGPSSFRSEVAAPAAAVAASVAAASGSPGSRERALRSLLEMKRAGELERLAQEACDATADPPSPQLLPRCPPPPAQPKPEPPKVVGYCAAKGVAACGSGRVSGGGQQAADNGSRSGSSSSSGGGDLSGAPPPSGGPQEANRSRCQPAGVDAASEVNETAPPPPPVDCSCGVAGRRSTVTDFLGGGGDGGVGGGSCGSAAEGSVAGGGERRGRGEARASSVGRRSTLTDFLCDGDGKDASAAARTFAGRATCDSSGGVRGRGGAGRNQEAHTHSSGHRSTVTDFIGDDRGNACANSFNFALGGGGGGADVSGSRASVSRPSIGQAHSGGHHSTVTDFLSDDDGNDGAASGFSLALGYGDGGSVVRGSAASAGQAPLRSDGASCTSGGGRRATVTDFLGDGGSGSGSGSVAAGAGGRDLQVVTTVVADELRDHVAAPVVAAAVAGEPCKPASH